MGLVPQRTLGKAVGCSGIGLHSGVQVAMTLRPAAPDSGIRFRRNDAAGTAFEIAASWHNAVETPLCTTLAGPGGILVTSVEHVLSALLGAGVDNAVVELDGGEVPSLDGSAAPFLRLIERAGTVAQARSRRFLQVLKRVWVSEPGRSAALLPDDRFVVDVEIGFDDPAVGRQARCLEVTPEAYARELAPARTFGFLEQVDGLRARGLIKGGSLNNAVVLCGGRVLNREGLRFADEFVRHKALDAVGDLGLAGAPLLGRYRGRCAGHALTLKLLRALFADPEAWCWREAAAGGGRVRQRQATPVAASPV